MSKVQRCYDSGISEKTYYYYKFPKLKSLRRYINLAEIIKLFRLYNIHGLRHLNYKPSITFILPLENTTISHIKM